MSGNIALEEVDGVIRVSFVKGSGDPQVAGFQEVTILCPDAVHYA